MKEIDVKIINKSNNPDPSYGTSQSAGMDLRAFVPEVHLTIAPGERALIRTGLYMQLPEGYEAQIRGRSGLALKRGVRVFHGVGTIDADYRGEIGVILENAGNEPFVVEDGDRIAQMVIAKHERARLSIVEQLDDSGRGEGGFGHTGIA